MADVTVTEASVVPASGATIITVTAGATVTAGQTGYKDTADSNQYKGGDADAQASAVAAGVFCTGAADEQPVVLCTAGSIVLGTAGCVTVGTPYVVSTNVGGICPWTDNASGDFITHLGIGTTSTTILLDIQSGGVAIP